MLSLCVYYSRLRSNQTLIAKRAKLKTFKTVTTGQANLFNRTVMYNSSILFDTTVMYEGKLLLSRLLKKPQLYSTSIVQYFDHLGAVLLDRSTAAVPGDQLARTASQSRYPSHRSGHRASPAAVAAVAAPWPAAGI
jgi:hypothetical protein